MTEQLAGIKMNQESAFLRGDVCTVYTAFRQGGVRSGLAMTAETRFFQRLTRRMMRAEQVGAQDVRDFTIEYFNVLCGKITGLLYRDTGVAARFQIPSFCAGRYEREAGWGRWELPFRSDMDEGAMLVHFKAPVRAGETNAK